MHRLLLLLLILVAACGPKRITIRSPAATDAVAAGIPVHVHYPVDVRPAEERRDGGYFYATPPVPLVVYGDANVRPHPIEAVYRTAGNALRAAGVPLASEGDRALQVDLFVLHHGGWRDTSDAHWVSTVSGGLAATVPKFAYPLFAEIRIAVRVQIRDADGRVLVVRDVSSEQIRKKPVALAWGLWSFYRRSPVARMFEEAFAAAHDDLGRQIAAVVAQTRAGGPVTAGLSPDEPAQHALAPRWERPDSLGSLKNPDVVAAADRKYGSARFSGFTGHELHKGNVVGRISLPLDTFGWELAVHDRVQLTIELTVLGLYNSAEVGARAHFLRIGKSSFAIQGSFGADIALLRENKYIPIVAAVHGGAKLQASTRPGTGPVTWYVQGGATAIDVLQPVQDLVELEPGPAFSIFSGPGVEYQVSPTTVIGAQVHFTGSFQRGAPIRLGNLGPLLVVPRIGLGFR